MTRAEKIALLTNALQGQTGALRELQRRRAAVSGVVICEQQDLSPDSQVCWWREDGSRVVETHADLSRREQVGGLIYLPHNGREPFFDPEQEPSTIPPIT